MSFMDTIKSLFGGNIEGKASELITTIINTVKPLLAEGKLSEAVQGAIGDYGDLGDKLKAILSKLTGATADVKTGLVKEKTDIVAAIKEKGGALLATLEKESAIPETLKALITKAKALLAKL